MKIKIIKKSIKEGTTSTGSEYCIKSLFVSFTEPEIYEKIVNHLKAMAVGIESIEKFCKPNEYNGSISYAFWLNCSHFTFDRVERFGILDANIIFGQNDKGYVNAKIQVLDKKEQINGYESPEEEVTGWSIPAPESTKNAQELVDAYNAENAPILPKFDSLDPKDVNDLPF